MSTQLSANTVKVKLSEFRKHCRDLAAEAEAETAPCLPVLDLPREEAETGVEDGS